MGARQDPVLGTRPAEPPRGGEPRGVSLLGGQAMLVGGALIGVFGIMALVLWTRGGTLWKALIPASLGIPFFLVGARARWRTRRLWRKGACCEGTVTYAEKKSSGQSDNRSVWYVAHYEYVVDGVQHTAKHGTHSLWNEGPTWVVYDPRNPQDSLPVRGGSP